MSNPKNQYKSLNALLKQVKKKSNNTRLESGSYIMEVVEVEMKQDKNGNPSFVWYLLPVDHPDCGTFLHRNTITNSESTIQVLVNDLKHCGVEVNKIEDLNDPKIQGKLIEKKILVRFENKDDGFYSTYFMKGA